MFTSAWKLEALKSKQLQNMTFLHNLHKKQFHLPVESFTTFQLFNFSACWRIFKP